MPALTKVLVANRAEIACRVIRGLREAGVASVAVYSEADADAPHVGLADESVAIGPAPAHKSYLDGDRIVAAALERRCDGVHPGYGFLSENAGFAAACERAGLRFIGPASATIALMGDKARARATMAAASVPVLPGSEAVLERSDAGEAAERLGFPLILKAVAGGGGIGMVVCRSTAELEKAFEPAKQRAASVFRNPGLYLERYVERPRHVEVQVVGDGQGEVVHLFERECSIQRRHQKVLEEAPAPALDDETRARLLEAAVRGARQVRYENAGTLEFLYDPDAGAFYFMEMNTRLQVEHPITEATTGRDLVRAQIEVARSGRLPFAQADVRREGHAIEARVYAEDPARGFAPSPGKIETLAWPDGDGIRVDAGYRQGQTVTPFYDPLLAKIVASGRTRGEAIDRLRCALERTDLVGPRTNLALHRRILGDPAFNRGQYDTTYLTTRKDLLG